MYDFNYQKQKPTVRSARQALHEALQQPLNWKYGLAIIGGFTTLLAVQVYFRKSKPLPTVKPSPSTATEPLNPSASEPFNEPLIEDSENEKIRHVMSLLGKKSGKVRRKKNGRRINPRPVS